MLRFFLFILWAGDVPVHFIWITCALFINAEHLLVWRPCDLKAEGFWRKLVLLHEFELKMKWFVLWLLRNWRFHSTHRESSSFCSSINKPLPNYTGLSLLLKTVCYSIGQWMGSNTALPRAQPSNKDLYKTHFKLCWSWTGNYFTPTPNQQQKRKRSFP